MERGKEKGIKRGKEKGTEHPPRLSFLVHQPFLQETGCISRNSKPIQILPPFSRFSEGSWSESIRKAMDTAVHVHQESLDWHGPESWLCGVNWTIRTGSVPSCTLPQTFRPRSTWVMCSVTPPTSLPGRDMCDLGWFLVGAVCALWSDV